MGRTILVFVISILSFHFSIAQKIAYIPNNLKAGINNCSSEYCMDRSYETPNLLFLWKSGATPGKPDMDAAENYFKYYYETMEFASTNPAASINKYKMTVLIDPAVGGGYAGTADNITSLLTIGNNSLGYVLAHEMGHAFCYHASMDSPEKYGFTNQPGPNGNRIYVGATWETVANYMAFQFPEIMTNASGDLQLYMRCYNYFFGRARDRYAGWPMFEALEVELGVTFLGRTWLESKDPEFQSETIIRLFANQDQDEGNDLFARAIMRIVKWDFREPLATQLRSAVARNTSEFTPMKFQTILKPVDVGKGRYAVSDNFAPQEYGFNAIRLFPVRDEKGESKVHVNFRGMHCNDNAGWRYGFVTVKSSGEIKYSEVYKKDHAVVTTNVDSDDTELYLVVVGAPTRHTNYGWEVGFPRVYRYRYELSIKNAVPEGYEPDFRKQGNITGAPHPNGEGFVASTARVASTAFIGPNAKVLGTATINNSARVEEWAVVNGAAVVGGQAIIKGHALVGENANIADRAIVADEAKVYGRCIVKDNAQILEGAWVSGGTISGSAIVKGNAYEVNQTISGTAIVGGDNQNTSASAGVYLQLPDNNNGRVAGDNKGENDITNIDINTVICEYASNAEMEIPVDVTGTESSSGSHLVHVKNLSSGLFSVKAGNKNVTVLVIDLFGREITKSNIHSGKEIDIDLANHPNGPYMMHVSTNQEYRCIKILMQN